MIHIAPWRVAEGLFAGVARLLEADGRLFLYGPFRRGGAHTAPSNAAFDRSLRDRNPEWGVRDLEAVETLAGSVGLDLIQISEMPANNLTLTLRTVAGGLTGLPMPGLPAPVPRSHSGRIEAKLAAGRRKH